jgi:hypothetical protein
MLERGRDRRACHVCLLRGAKSKYERQLCCAAAEKNKLKWRATVCQTENERREVARKLCALWGCAMSGNLPCSLIAPKTTTTSRAPGTTGYLAGAM